jgi:hypothetical protein
MTGLARDLEALCQLEHVFGRDVVVCALERAVAFGLGLMA